MDWDYFKMVGIVAGLSLIILTISEWVANRDWQGLRKPAPAWRILLEWVAFMGLFFMLSLILQKLWRLSCVICG